MAILQCSESRFAMSRTLHRESLNSRIDTRRIAFPRLFFRAAERVTGLAAYTRSPPTSS